ncbi:hypothetical protein MMC30_000463 [Trapelia coarctata]|nr:hypothetical protein [Trapelia coarctata]
MTSRYAPLSQHASNVRTYHKDSEKASRRAAEEAREADQEYETALGMCLEYMAEKIGVDAEFARRIDTARVTAAKRNQLIEEDAITTNKHMVALHSELNHIHGDIVAIQKTLGITEPAPANGGAETVESGTAQTVGA